MLTTVNISSGALQALTRLDRSSGVGRSTGDVIAATLASFCEAFGRGLAVHVVNDVCRSTFSFLAPSLLYRL